MSESSGVVGQVLQFALASFQRVPFCMCRIRKTCDASHLHLLWNLAHCAK